MNSHNRFEVKQGVSGDSQAVTESETSNEMSLTPPQDPLEQATEVSHHSDVAKCTAKICGDFNAEFITLHYKAGELGEEIF